jgi:hypothetical protein
VLAAIALTPSAPVLVPRLAGSATEAEPVRAAAIAAATALPQRWIAVGAGPRDETYTGVRGTFAGYGADVEVALSPQAPTGVVAMPLCALIAGWLRGQALPEATVDLRVYDACRDALAAVDSGRRLRAEIDRDGQPVGVLVVADGANTLTQGAPGGFDPDSEPDQSALDRALATADTAALTRLPDRIVGRVAYEVLAGLAGPTGWSAQEMYRGAPYGVGYFAGVWRPATA